MSRGLLRRAMINNKTLQQLWATCPSAIDTADGETCYWVPASAARDTRPPPLPTLLTADKRWRKWVCLTAYNPMAQKVGDAENAIANDRLLKKLQQHGGGSTVHGSYSWDAAAETWFEPGFAVPVGDGAGSSYDEVIGFAREARQKAVYVYEQRSDSEQGTVIQSVVNCDGDPSTESCVEVVRASSRPRASSDELHPVFLSPHTFHIYHDLPSVLEFVEQWAQVDDSLRSSAQMTLLLEKAHEALADLEMTVTSSVKIVALEGLDGTGKSSVAREFAKALGTEVARTPPTSILQLREFFDARPEPLRRAFYGLGNYIFAHEVAKSGSASPFVVVDRFWHSTAAYAIAKSVQLVDDLPSPNAALYAWPQDLLRPRLVVLLEASPEVRTSRIHSRGEAITPEERLLAITAPNSLSMRAGVAYDRLLKAFDPSLIRTINTERPLDDVLSESRAIVQTLLL